MKRSAFVFFAAVMAALPLGASAATSVYVQAGPPPVYVAPVPRYYAYEGHEYEHFAHRGCGAPAWDPNARYMPGQVVWRNGRLWMATEESAHVWNVNSPPEWTPNYWVRARCR